MTTATDQVSVPRFLSVYFADDLRQEVDGKLTMVGVYQSAMIFPSFPAVIPKLAVIMMAVTPARQPFKKLVFKLQKNEELLQSFEVDPEQLKAIEEDSAKTKVDGIRVAELQFAAVLGSLSFDGPCILRTRLETESETIAGRSLSVTSAAIASSDGS